MDGHTLSQFCNRRRTSALQQLAILIFSTIAILICHPRLSKCATYSRSTATGNWNDGNWTPSSGLIDGAPPKSEAVTIDAGVVLDFNDSTEIRYLKIDSVINTGPGFQFAVVYGTATLNIAGDARINTLFLDRGSVVNVTQPLNALSGLSIESEFFAFGGTQLGEVLNLNFDSSEIPGQLDWAFRVRYDKRWLIEPWLTGSNINVFGAPQPVSVIYESALYGDYTYIGYIAAVPEPGQLLIIGVATSVLILWRANSKNVRSGHKIDTARSIL